MKYDNTSIHNPACENNNFKLRLRLRVAAAGRFRLRLRVGCEYGYGCGYGCGLRLPFGTAAGTHCICQPHTHLPATLHLLASATSRRPPYICPHPPRHLASATPRMPAKKPCVSMGGGGGVGGGLHALTSTHFLDPRTLTRTHYLHAHARTHTRTRTNPCKHARTH